MLFTGLVEDNIPCAQLFLADFPITFLKLKFSESRMDRIKMSCARKNVICSVQI